MRYALIVLTLLLCSCAPKVEPTKNSIEPGTRIIVPSFEYRILSQADLDKQCGRAVHGCTGWNLDTGRQVIYSAPPLFVDGSQTKTVGHEVLHIALGDYHR